MTNRDDEIQGRKSALYIEPALDSEKKNKSSGREAPTTQTRKIKIKEDRRMRPKT